jgi:hypothetical protein
VTGLSALVMLALLEASLVPGYKIAESEAGYIHWEMDTVRYRINEAGSDDASDASDIDAVKRSFDEWNDVSCAYIHLDFDGLTANTGAGDAAGASDGINLVLWREDPAEWIAAGNSPAYYALTTLSFDIHTGALRDADIEVNGAFHTYTTSDEVVSIDVQNVLTHEAGHVLGLDHSSDREATMYHKAAAGETKKRDLSADDREALCFLYPTQGDPPWLGQDLSRSSGCALGGVSARRVGGCEPWLLLAGLLSVTYGYGHRGRRFDRDVEL